jgi:hypothetical protein
VPVGNTGGTSVGAIGSGGGISQGGTGGSIDSGTTGGFTITPDAAIESGTGNSANFNLSAAMAAVVDTEEANPFNATSDTLASITRGIGSLAARIAVLKARTF